MTADAEVETAIAASALVNGHTYLFHTAVIKGVHVTLFLIVH